MSLIKVLYISVFIFVKPIPWSGPDQSQCDDLSVKSSITYIQGVGAKVDIEAKGAVSPYKYVFYKETGHLLTENFDTNSVSKLQKGKYYCTVLGKKGCYKTIEFEIK